MVCSSDVTWPLSLTRPGVSTPHVTAADLYGTLFLHESAIFRSRTLAVTMLFEELIPEDCKCYTTELLKTSHFQSLPERTREIVRCENRFKLTYDGLLQLSHRVDVLEKRTPDYRTAPVPDNRIDAAKELIVPTVTPASADPSLLLAVLLVIALCFWPLAAYAVFHRSA